MRGLDAPRVASDGEQDREHPRAFRAVPAADEHHRGGPHPRGPPTRRVGLVPGGSWRAEAVRRSRVAAWQSRARARRAFYLAEARPTRGRPGDLLRGPAVFQGSLLAV